MPSLRNRKQINERLRQVESGVALMAKENKAERTGESTNQYPDEEKELGWR